MTSRGIDRERRVKALLEDEGWVVMRAAGSLGICDLIALRQESDGLGGPPYIGAMLIEVKSDIGYPFRHFGPGKRRALIAAADRSGAEAWLAWWPPRRPGPEWIPTTRWPE